MFHTLWPDLPCLQTPLPSKTTSVTPSRQWTILTTDLCHSLHTSNPPNESNTFVWRSSPSPIASENQHCVWCWRHLRPQEQLVQLHQPSPLCSRSNSSKVSSQLNWRYPIPKSGDHSQATNYRPISLLPIIFKVLERIIHSRLMKFLTANKLLSSKQFGFRAGSSTRDALLSVTNDWHGALELSKQLELSFLTQGRHLTQYCMIVSYLHLPRLECLSGKLYKWLANYLSNRKQRVVLDGTSSSLSSVTSGIPPGSILGPVLCIVFLKSITNVSLSQGSTIILYAYDILLYKPRQMYNSSSMMSTPCSTGSTKMASGLTTQKSSC